MTQLKAQLNILTQLEQYVWLCDKIVSWLEGKLSAPKDQKPVAAPVGPEMNIPIRGAVEGLRISVKDAELWWLHTHHLFITFPFIETLLWDIFQSIA